MGVEIKKESVAPRDAPLRRNVAANGITLHEHKGKGAPNKAALYTALCVFGPRCFCTHDYLTN